MQKECDTISDVNMGICMAISQIVVISILDHKSRS